MEPNRTCTSLDHVYPFTVFDGKPKKGTPCYCGERKWGVEHKPKPKPKGVPREENPAHDSDSESTMDPVPTAEGSGELNVEVNSDQQV